MRFVPPQMNLVSVGRPWFSLPVLTLLALICQTHIFEQASRVLRASVCTMRGQCLRENYHVVEF